MIALAGNPNAGKSLIFNILTGSRQNIGNYPGVTVEKKVGKMIMNGKSVDILDLPGIYSLMANSPEEVIAIKVLMQEKIDFVVNIVDASNLERNLYLTLQLIELKVPLIIVLNMIDVADSNGLMIDSDKLSSLLGVPIIKTSAKKMIGIDHLKEKIMTLKESDFEAKYNIDIYKNTKLRKLISYIQDEISYAKSDNEDIYKWKSIKLLEKDSLITNQLSSDHLIDKEQLDIISEKITTFEKEHNISTEDLIINEKFAFINDIYKESVQEIKDKNTVTVSDKIDNVLTHKFLGIPIFLLMMYLVFNLTFVMGSPLMDLIDNIFGMLGNFISSFFDEESILKSLLVDGIIGGVGGVLVFLPNIVILFVAISFIEGTGYMARAAFIMDKFLALFGLSGKSFIPLVIGFGCSIPAIMATRNLESHRDRVVTILVVPLMSCSARLPIYLMIIPAFFEPEYHPIVMWLIYIIGIILAVLSALLLRSTIFASDKTPFIMELPRYTIPSFKSVVLTVYYRSLSYLKKAGTTILVASILLWVASTYPKNEDLELGYKAKIERVAELDLPVEMKDKALMEIHSEYDQQRIENTITGRVGKFMSVVISPLGFDWRIGTALIGALAAKEVFVAQMSIVLSMSGVDAEHESEFLINKLRSHYTPLQGFCIMLFCLISSPCIATFAITRKETNSLRWPVFQFLFLTLLGYIVTFAVYQTGNFAIG